MRTLSLKVKPNARHARLTEQADGTWVAEVNAPPIDGKANEAVIALVAAHFGVPKSRVDIKSGASSRLKRIQIND
ncbi:MAG: DUF167 domain-containing protein [Burkholderiales bacterium]|nr:DUF167 domain-containing protein [Burkholderiales bacterium]